MSRLLFLPLAWCIAFPAAAQFEAPAVPCPPGVAEATLRGADVEAALFTNGNLFYGNQRTSGNGYAVPVASGNSPVFASNLWAGGVVGGEVRTAAAKYTNFRMRPGLTGTDGAPPSPEACAEADRIWLVTDQDIADYEAGGAPSPDLAEWPLHLGAPVLDGDGIAGNYDLEAGDRPAVRGSATAFWVMTDTATEAVLPDQLPLGIDVAVEAFAFRQRQLGQHTFYRFTVTNRNDVPIEEMYVGMFDELDLGDASDDYAGTDSTLHLAYTYNSRDTDNAYGIPPAGGFVVLESPAGLPNGRDDDYDGVTDEPGESLGLSTRTYMINGASPSTTGDPNTSQQYYNRMRGLWGDATPIRAYGNGYRQPTQYPVTPFAFPGDPVAEQFWSEVNVDGMGTDSPFGQRKGSLASGPLRLLPDSSVVFTVGLLFAQGADRFASVRALRGQARGVLAAQASGAFEPGVFLGSLPPSPRPPRPPLAISRPRPNPFANATAVEIQGAFDTPVRVSVYDVLGRRLSTTETSAPEARVEVGAGLASGVYVVRVEGVGFAQTFTIVKTL